MSAPSKRRWRVTEIEIPEEVVEAGARAWVGSMMDDEAKTGAQEDVRATVRAILRAAMLEWKGDRPTWANVGVDSRMAWYENRVKELERTGYDARELADQLHEILS